jgi:hypothetical protein
MTRFAKIGLRSQGFRAFHGPRTGWNGLGAALVAAGRSPGLRAAALAALALLSGLLSDVTLGWLDRPFPVLPGVWFGLVLVAGVALWATSRKLALVVVFAAINLAWWGGFQASVFLYPYVQDLSALPAVLSGMVGGLIGSAITVAGVAYACPSLGTRTTWTRTLAAGSLAGILLEGIDIGNGSALPLLLVWQAAVAASIGWGLTPAPRSH